MGIYQLYHSSRTSKDQEFYKRQAKSLEDRIDTLIYELYDITEIEKKLIEATLIGIERV